MSEIPDIPHPSESLESREQGSAELAPLSNEELAELRSRVVPEPSKTTRRLLARLDNSERVIEVARDRVLNASKHECTPAFFYELLELLPRPSAPDNHRA